MTFRPRNTYYLRISATTVLPLHLYLDERHLDWMSDTVLQHVLADLRPLIIPKLHAERDIHFGAGLMPGWRKGSVEVHRGEFYQFAYFFRKTESHSVVVKSRYFVAAPTPLEAQPAPVAWSNKDEGRKRRRGRLPTNRTQRKRPKTKGKSKDSGSYLEEGEEEEEFSLEESGEDVDLQAQPQGASSVRRRSQRERRVVAGGYHEDSEDELGDDDDGDVDMVPVPESGSDGEQAPPYTDDPRAAISSVSTENIKLEDIDEQMGGDADIAIEGEQAGAETEIDLTIEEEERKPKPLLKLKYQAFALSGHCLCVVVEPWPPERLARAESIASLVPSHATSSYASTKDQRAQTPLFLPEHDRAPSEAPFPRARTLPHVPLFDENVAGPEADGYTSDDLLHFSQVLNSTGNAHATSADDDDEMDGAILFGDADEVRELL